MLAACAGARFAGSERMAAHAPRYARVMRTLSLVVVVVAAVTSVVGACSRKAAPPEQAAPGSAASPAREHHHEDRHDPATAPKQLVLAIAITGQPSVTWDAAAFAKVAQVPGKASDGEARETWSLRDLAHTLVGPKARVTAVIGRDGTAALTEARWADAAATPILHTTRHGTLKFRWADPTGAWGATVAKDVTGLEIQP